MNPSISKLSTLTRILCMMCLVLWTSACTTSWRSVPPVNTTSHTRTNAQWHDSTYHRDSIFVREYIRGDTVYLDRWRDRWRERVVLRADTVFRDREVQIQLPPERYVPRIVKGLACIGAAAILALLLWLLLKIRG